MKESIESTIDQSELRKSRTRLSRDWQEDDSSRSRMDRFTSGRVSFRENKLAVPRKARILETFSGSTSVMTI